MTKDEKPARSGLLASSFALLCTAACTTVPAALAVAKHDPAPASVAASEAPQTPQAQSAAAKEPTVDWSDQLHPLDTSAVFDGRTELLVPANFRALIPFGSLMATLEFEESAKKLEKRRKLPGPWEAQLIRWTRDDPNAAVELLALLERAIAHRPTWTLGPAGCDDSDKEGLDQCYVREASIVWIETSYDEQRARGQAVIEVGGSADEAGPMRYMLVTTLTRGADVYALIYELHADQWRVHEELVRASALSFEAR